MIINKTTGKKVIAFILTLIMVISVINLNTVISNAAEGRAADPTILTDVKVLHQDSSTGEYIEGGTWASWQKLRVQFQWEIPNDMTVLEGDYLTITLPEELKLVGDMTIDMKDNKTGSLVATATTDKANKTVKIVFTDFAENNKDVKGSLWFESGFDKYTELKERTIPVTFAINGSTQYSLESQGLYLPPIGYDDNQTTYLSKHADFTSDNSAIFYTVRVHASGQNFTGKTITLEDSLKENLKLKENDPKRTYADTGLKFANPMKATLSRVYYYNDAKGAQAHIYKTIDPSKYTLTVGDDRKSLTLVYTGEDDFTAEGLSKASEAEHVRIVGGGYWLSYTLDVEGGARPDVVYSNSAAVSWDDIEQYSTNIGKSYSIGGGNASGTKIDGSLEVSKTVTGDAKPDADTEFTFVVKKDGVAVKKAPYTIDNVAGETDEKTGHFTLKGGKTAIFKDLTKADGYTVEEIDPLEPEDADLTTTYKVNADDPSSGEESSAFAITKTGVATVVFTNKYDPKVTEPITDPITDPTDPIDPSDEEVTDPSGQTTLADPIDPSTDPDEIVESSSEDGKYEPPTTPSTDPDEVVETSSETGKYDPSSTVDEDIDESSQSNKYDPNANATQTGDDSNMPLYAGLAALAALVAAGTAIPAMRRRINK